MKCLNCKKKVSRKDSFCIHCGSSLQKVKRKHKMRFILILGILLILCGAFSVISYMNSPKYIALKYFKAVISNDLDKVYAYIDTDSPFVSLDLLKEKDTTTYSNVSYKVQGIEKANDYVYVEMLYEVDGEEKDGYIALKQEKFLGIFNTYKVESGKVAKNVSIRVLKDSKVTIDDVDISSYFKKVDGAYDVYALPDMIVGEYKVNVVMDNGISMDKTIDIATDSSYTICKVSLDSSLKEELSSTILSNLNTLYQASIQNKSYSEISDNFKNDLSSLYNQLRRSLAYKKINSIEFTDVDITTSTFNDDGMLELEVFADYKMSYNDEDTEDYVSYTVLLDYNDDSFVLSDFSYSHQEKSDVSYE